MLITHADKSVIVFRQRPVRAAPALLLTNKIGGEVTFPELITLRVVVLPAVDPSLSYRGSSVTTLRRGEGWVHVNDLARGETIRCWLKSRHYLVAGPSRGDVTLTHRYAGKSGSTRRGYFLTQIRGTLMLNDIANQEFHIVCSPGAHGWPYRVSGVGIVPWLSIRRIEVVRPRYNADGIDNPRFPLILPIRFPGWRDKYR